MLPPFAFDRFDAVDLFSGPRGWSVGIADLGLRDLGIEWDAAACATAVANGHATWQADVEQVDPALFAGVRGFIASPPCQDFSAAGSKAGRAGERGRLVDVPPVWVEVIMPEWVACEQVPAVLPIWKQHAARYRELGYSTWCGILNAADYGVPQTRRRAILMASRVKAVSPPAPTHERNPGGSLFDALEPWVTMAQALGWGLMRPSHTLAPGTGGGGADPMMAGGSGARASIARDVDAGRFIHQAGVNTGRDFRVPGDRSSGQFRAAGEPAPTLTGKSGGQWHLRPGGTGYADPNRRLYEADEPAPTNAFGHDAAAWAWHLPATTVCGDPRITARCHHDAGSQGANAKTTEQVRAGDYDGTEPIRMTVAEALTLQSFRPDMFVAGSLTKQFEQVGNAVPPLLARAIVAALV